MYYGLLDELLSRTLNLVGIEYALDSFEASRWGTEKLTGGYAIDFAKWRLIVNKTA